jgi:hypothetical protein
VGFVAIGSGIWWRVVVTMGNGVWRWVVVAMGSIIWRWVGSLKRSGIRKRDVSL